MWLFLWHSLVWIPTTPTCNGVYYFWYGFVVISITRRGGISRIFTLLLSVLFLALSRIVLIRSFVPGFSIIPFRFCTISMVSSIEEKWWRFAPSSTTNFLEKVLQYMVNDIAALIDTLRIFWRQKYQPDIDR